MKVGSPFCAAPVIFGSMRRCFAIVAWLGCAAALRADGWRLEQLPSPPSGWHVSPNAINASGQIAGSYRVEGDPPETTKALLFDGSAWRSLGTLGGNNSYAEGLNDRGEVVGVSETTWTTECFPTPNGDEVCSHESHAFLWRDGAMHDLGSRGSWSRAEGINNAGIVAGTATGLAQRWLPMGTVDVSGDFGGGCLASEAMAINSRGQIVGAASVAGGFHAFLWDDVIGPRDLETLGGPSSGAFSIGDAGQVVGNSETATTIGCQTNEWGTFCIYEVHPFLWSNGEMIDLGTLGGPNAYASGVNSLGEVVGVSETTEKRHCFPEGGSEQCIYRFHAFVWSHGQMVDLGEPGLPSYAAGINERGDIVGAAQKAPGMPLRPVIWRRQ